MISAHQFWRRAKLPLAVSLASTLAGPAFGVSFNIGEIEGSFDSSLSVGASWSTAGRNKDLIGVNNGGRGLSQTSDDGHLNFDKGDAFSKIFKGIHDLELKYGDTGVFVRGKYWYDFALQNEDLEFKNVSNDGRKEGAKSSGGEILDAFIYHNYSIADEPGSVRLGKQVVSWGESTFIGGGINAVNPIDVAAFRRPGAEIKEGLIPVNMFYVSQTLTENLSAEGFYQLDWEKTVTDNCGTFFSQADVITGGCNDNLRLLSKRSVITAGGGLPLMNQFGVNINEEGVLVKRGADRDARDSGQFGVAMHYNFEPLDTEFGAYFMNYHSRAPIFSAKGASAATYAAANALTFTPASSLRPLIVAGNSSYFVEYPEDIRLYGLSFSTTLPTGTAWSGEISYRPNAPVQLNTTDLTLALVNPLSGGTSSPLQTSAGADNSGYRRKEITQIQSTLTQFFDQVLGAERLTLVGEAGMTYVGGLETKDKVRYGRDSVYGAYGYQGDTSGFVTATSWGYRARAILDYSNVFAGINLKPNVSWSHDVKGYGPNGIFNQGAKAVSIGLDADYRNTYTASLSFTDFFGGNYNTLIDRDFVALSVGANF